MPRFPSAQGRLNHEPGFHLSCDEHLSEGWGPPLLHLNSAANLSDKPGPPHQIKRKNDDENHNRNNTRAVDVHSRVRG